MSLSKEIPFEHLLVSLLDEKKPLAPRNLYRFSDLGSADLKKLVSIWPKIPLWRRQALMGDLYQLSESDTVLSFSQVSRLALQDEDPSVRLLAVRTLIDYEEDDLIDTFIDMLEHDPDTDVRAASATALSPFVYLGELEEISPKRMRAVEECLLGVIAGNDQVLVRRKAVEALSFTSREEIEPIIDNAYHSKDTDWLVTALFSMGRSANKRWNDQVLAKLDDKRPAVRAEAAGAAGELEINEAVPRLLEMLDEDDEDIRAAAIWSLSQIGGEGVRESLEDMLDEIENDDEAELIENALENLTLTEDFLALSIMELPDETPENLDKDIYFYPEDSELEEEETEDEDEDDED